MIDVVDAASLMVTIQVLKSIDGRLRSMARCLSVCGVRIRCDRSRKPVISL